MSTCCDNLEWDSALGCCREKETWTPRKKAFEEFLSRRYTSEMSARIVKEFFVSRTRVPREPLPTEAETYWRQQIGKKVRITKGLFIEGRTGILRDCCEDEGRVDVDWGGRIPVPQDFPYDALEVVEPLVLTQKDVGKKFLVIRGILKGEEGELFSMWEGNLDVVFRSSSYSFHAYIPVEDLEPVD